MVLHVQNPTTQIIELEVEVRGNFPAHWCRWHLEGREIRPKQEMLIGIDFEVPSDFFENQQIFLEQKSQSFDYQSTVYVYYQIRESQQQQLETLGFNLYVRPRSLYLNFLPTLYREVDFIGRLLHIFEQTFEPTVQSLEAIWAYLDPLTAPEALLPFLAHWIGWQMISGLNVARQRYLIRNAIELYRWRGTKKGLRFYLHLYTGLPLDEELPETDKHICIEEPLGLGFVLGEAHLGRETVLGGGRPYHFLVRLRSQFPNQVDETLVRKIIDQEKPVWCTYDLYIEELSP